MRAAALGFVAALVQAASAESKQDWDDCTSSDADVSLAGCSKIIGRAKDTKNNLAIAYFNRGIAYQNKGDHDIAVAASRSLSPMARCRPRPAISRPGSSRPGCRMDRAGPLG